MKPPDRIYLQIGDDSDTGFDGVSFNCCEGLLGTDVSWCDEQIFSTDVEYVLAPRERRLNRYRETQSPKENG